MADTAIEWADAVWNPTTGCDKVSPGCDNCYALTMAKRLKGMGQAKYQNDGDPRTSGPGFGLTVHEDALTIPLRWRKPRRIFVNSMSDLFHGGVPDEFIARVFAVMAATPQHTYQVLTKRHGRLRSLLSRDEFRLAVKDEHSKLQLAGIASYSPLVINVWPLPNVWLGVSVEDQKRADLRVPALLDTPAAVRWLSCEPLLGPVDLGRWLGPVDWPACWDEHSPSAECARCIQPEWVVVGGESGPGARPMHPAWARSLRDQCQRAEVPFFFKQHGEWLPLGPLYGESAEMDVAHLDAMYYEVNERRRIAQVEPDGTVVDPAERQPVDGTWLMARVGKKAAGRELDGRTWDEYPEAVRHAG